MTPGEDTRDWSGARQADEADSKSQIRESSALPVIRNLMPRFRQYGENARDSPYELQQKECPEH